MNKKDNVAVHRLSFNVHRYEETGIFNLTITIKQKTFVSGLFF